MQDPVSKLYEMELTVEEQEDIRRMKVADVLAMRKIKLYAIKRNPNIYVFYFAISAWQVQELYYQIYNMWENRVVDAYNQMIDKSLYFPDTKETKTFRELMGETVVLPRWVFEMWGE